MRNRRIIGPLAFVLALVALWPGAADAAQFTTSVTCDSQGTCSGATTDPAAGSGKVSIAGGGTPAGGFQIFVIQELPGVEVTAVKVTYSDSTTETLAASVRAHLLDVSPTKFVTRFEVTWNDSPTTTTTGSTTSTTPTSSTTTTTTPSTTTTSSTTTTTTTTTVPRGPGYGPVPIRNDGVLQSSPDAAAVRGTERIDVVVRGTDNAVYWTSQDNPRPWTGWVRLGLPSSGAVKGDPSIVSWAPGRLDVFVRGTDDKLWQDSSADGGATWTGWYKPLGDDGVLASGPDTSSRGPGRLDVFVLGTDGQIYERFFENGNWNAGWIPLGSPTGGTTIASGPTTASWDGVRHDIFVVGSDGRLWQKFWNGQSWSGWFHPAGTDPALVTGSAPDATSWGPGHLAVYAHGPNDALYRLQFNNGGWSAWVRMGGPVDKLRDGPGVASRGNGRLDAIVRGTDDLAYQFWE